MKKSNQGILNKIMTMLSMSVTLATMKLDNGNEVEAESFEAGSEIYLVEGDAKELLKAGTYNCENGATIVVEEDGIIASYMEKEIMAEDMPKEMPEDMPKEVAVNAEEIIKAVVDTMQPMFDDLQAQIDELKKGAETTKETLSKVAQPEIVSLKKQAVPRTKAMLSNQNVSSAEENILKILNN